MWTPAYPDPGPATPVPVNLGGLGGIQQETAEMGKEKLAKFSAGKKHARGRVAIFQFILSCCHDNRQRAGQA